MFVPCDGQSVGGRGGPGPVGLVDFDANVQQHACRKSYTVVGLCTRHRVKKRRLSAGECEKRFPHFRVYETRMRGEWDGLLEKREYVRATDDVSTTAR